jgi:prepilin-type N-terminal cleavage/methylation domain-containing protein
VKPTIAAKKRGLTLVELVLGLVVVSMVAGATGAMMTAVGAGWAHGNQVEVSTSVSTQAMVRIQKILRAAKQIGVCRTGGISGSPSQSAAVLIWKGDINGDGHIQVSELALIEHQSSANPASAQLVCWELVFPSTWTTAQKQAQDLTLADDAIYSDAEIDSFKATTNVRAAGIVTCVTAAEFHRIDSSGTVRPALEYALKFNKDGVVIVKYGRTTSRTPAALPASQS